MFISQLSIISNTFARPHEVLSVIRIAQSENTLIYPCDQVGVMSDHFHQENPRSEILHERSKIPIRSESSFGSPEKCDRVGRESVHGASTSRKRNSMMAYPLQSSRLPIPISSCNDLNFFLNDPRASTSKISRNIYSSKRLSLVHTQSDKPRSDHRLSMNAENLMPAKENMVHHSNLPKMSSLSLDSKLHKSPSLKYSSDTPLKARANNTVLSNQNIQTPKKSQLKFSYITRSNQKAFGSESLPSSQILNSNASRNSSVTNISQNFSKERRLSAASSRASISLGCKGKIKNVRELISIIRESPTSRSKFELCQHTSSSVPDEEDRKKFYPFEDLSSKRPDLFQKLTMYERIMQYPQIYFTGLPKHLKVKSDLKNPKCNYGFDDKRGNYIISIGDHIRYKYEINSTLGNGAFGSVVSVSDHSSKSKIVLACKIIKNDPRWSLQAVEEIKILKKLNHPNIVKYVEHFTFRTHMCIVTEILAITLYESIQLTNYKGFSLNLVKKFTREILQGVAYLHSNNIIHCDLKPENIMISGDGTIKIIDFGSSCHTDSLKYSYLQSRFYRAPEVLLGGRYDTKMDIWSIALISLETFAGVPLFQPQNEWELFSLCVKFLNIPSRKYILKLRAEIETLGFVGAEKRSQQEACSNTILWKAFNSNGIMNIEYINHKIQHVKTGHTKQLNPGHGSIKNFLRKHAYYGDTTATFTIAEKEAEISRFLVYIEMCMLWNKWGRATAEECLQLEFFTCSEEAN